MKQVYLDYSATTPTKKAVVDAMIPYFTEDFGNAASVHAYGRKTKKVMSESREFIAGTINAVSDEIYFTSGGTESDNWAIKGIMKANQKKGNHLITTTVEHHAILHAAESLAKDGYDVTYLPVDEEGLIDLKALEAAIKPTTVLVSIMHVNNEIGTAQDITAIGALCKEKGVLFHTDAVQGYGNFRFDVKAMNIDLMTMSAHKIYGPKGIGALYIKKGVRIANLMHGGAQEKKRRPGTHNIPGIVGFAKAAELAYADLDAHITKLTALRERLIEGITSKIKYCKVNGSRAHRHPGNVNISFEFIEGESLLLSLDLKGIASSSGSACTSGSLDPSHVLMGIGLPHSIAHGSLRLTIGDFTTEEDIDYTIDALVEIVDRLRQMSPLYEGVE